MIMSGSVLLGGGKSFKSPSFFPIEGIDGRDGVADVASAVVLHGLMFAFGSGVIVFTRIGVFFSLEGTPASEVDLAFPIGSVLFVAARADGANAPVVGGMGAP